jgi:Uma2 family endonuclease
VYNEGVTLLDAILRSPAAPEWSRKLQDALAAESKRREAFRDWLTPETKAEFINGEVVVHSPARNDHNRVGLRIAHVLDAYAIRRKLGQVGAEKNLISLTRNDYEPDVCWWSSEKSVHFRPDTMVFPAPDLVVEVLSPSTEARDRGIKFEDYAAHGITEYWLVDAELKGVEQYVLSQGTYQLKMKSSSGTLDSSAAGGIAFPVEALFDDEPHARLLKSIWAS